MTWAASRLQSVIIINQHYGELCNQLFLYSHLLAHAVETGNRVWFPAFHRYERDFPFFRRGAGPVRGFVVANSAFHPHQQRVDWLFRRFLHADSKILRWANRLLRCRIQLSLDYHAETCHPESGDAGPPRPLCLFEGWRFRVPRAFRRHQDVIRSVFEFDDATRDKVRRWLDGIGARQVIGVHIRQGDYQSACPQWCYPLDAYLAWMRSIRESGGGDCAFVVVSDARLADFDEPGVFHHRGNAIEDLCVLSQCDCVLGPPSTFNRWAAFMGNRRHLCIWSGDQDVRHADFKRFSMTTPGVELTAGEIEAIGWFGIA
jgi:hypothetical protein